MCFIVFNKELDKVKTKLRVKRYSPNTVKVYLSFLKSYFYFHQKEPSLLISEDVRPFIDQLVKKGLSHSTQNQAINAIKFYYEKVLNREVAYYYWDRPIKEKRLPIVLSKEEVKSILSSIKNLKHQCMISLIYSCGLRAGELLNLKIGDVDSHNMILRISQAKGKKDRIVPLSGKVLSLLRIYYQEFRPWDYLFEGQAGAGHRYSNTSLRKILSRAVKNAAIKTRVNLHTLRHSYATHLLESGVGLRQIQVILGHNSSKTTEIYTHVSKSSIHEIRSPIDDLL